MSQNFASLNTFIFLSYFFVIYMVFLEIVLKFILEPISSQSFFFKSGSFSGRFACCLAREMSSYAQEIELIRK